MELPIPDDWDGTSCCRWAIKWPDSPKWQAILSGLIERPMQGRTWDFETGTFLDLREQFRPFYDYNFDLKEVYMACDDTQIADALLAIAAALESSGGGTGGGTINQNVNCCEETIININGGVQGSIPGDEETPDQPIYGSEPPGDIGPGEFPEGFETIEDYQVYKCQVATAIINDAIAALRRLAIITLWNASGLGGVIIAALAGALVFPPALLPTLIALLIGLAVVQFYLNDLANQIEANKQEYVCALYGSSGATEAITLLAQLIEVAIGLIPVVGNFAVLLKGVAMVIFNTDTINSLYVYKANAAYPDADCSDCVVTTECFDFEIEQDLMGWNVVDETGGTVDLSIVASGMEVVTGSPTDMQHTVFASPTIDYTIQTGDIFYILYTTDPVPYGRTLWLWLDGVRTQIISEGTIVDHLVCAPVPLDDFVDAHVTKIEISINRAFGGTWIIRQAGFNCVCP